MRDAYLYIPPSVMVEFDVAKEQGYSLGVEPKRKPNFTTDFCSGSFFEWKHQRHDTPVDLVEETQHYSRFINIVDFTHMKAANIFLADIKAETPALFYQKDIARALRRIEQPAERAVDAYVTTQARKKELDEHWLAHVTAATAAFAPAMKEKADALRRAITASRAAYKSLRESIDVFETTSERVLSKADDTDSAAVAFTNAFERANEKVADYERGYDDDWSAFSGLGRTFDYYEPSMPRSVHYPIPKVWLAHAKPAKAVAGVKRSRSAAAAPAPVAAPEAAEPAPRLRRRRSGGTSGK
jgi:hypothetical protein